MRTRQRGAMMVLSAALLLTLTGVAIIVFDLGRMLLVRNEMQNVADAAALAGANCLTRESSAGSAVDCSSTLAGALNWDRAEAKATDQLGNNSAANVPIRTDDDGHVIQTGYYNLLTRGPSGGSFSRTFSPLTVNDKPAVRVMVRKGQGVNDGPVFMLSRAMFGGPQNVTMWAEAVAVISSPSAVLPGSLIPQAINQCMFDRFWDSATGTPRLYTGDNTGLPPDTWGLQTVGQPFVVRIGSAYHYGTCDSGQWTTFDRDANSAAEVRDLVMNGNPNPVEIGDLSWIKPGTSNSNYNDLDNRFPNLPVDVSVLVVEGEGEGGTDLSHLPPGGRELEITAFAGFRITDIRGASDKYIQGQFIPSNVTSGSSGIGPFFGTYTPPRIAR